MVFSHRVPLIQKGLLGLSLWALVTSLLKAVAHIKHSKPI